MRKTGRKVMLSEPQKLDAGHAQAYAIALLARRDHSTAELRRKLLDRGYLDQTIESVLLDLEQTRKLDDQRYGVNVVAYRSRRGQGPSRIRNELRKSGLKNEQIDAAVRSGDDAPDFLSLAREARRRKFGPEIPKDWKERARQARFLQYRGFSTDHIRAVLMGAPGDEDMGVEQGGETD